MWNSSMNSISPGQMDRMIRQMDRLGRDIDKNNKLMEEMVKLIKEGSKNGGNK